MSDNPTAIFADQAAPGMRIGPDRITAQGGQWVEPVTITQTRQVGSQTYLLGVHDDGAPFIFDCASHLPVLTYGLIEQVADDLSSL